MSSIFLRIPIALFGVALLAHSAISTPLVGRSGSLFTDIKAHDVGDIITVKIYEDAQATNLSQTNTTKEGKFETSGGPGIGSLDFIPLFGAAGENKNELFLSNKNRNYFQQLFFAPSKHELLCYFPAQYKPQCDMDKMEV